MPSLHILFASTSGHTEYVVDTLIAFLKKAKDLAIEKQRVEAATAEDLLRGDLIVLASSTWNTGGVEGQLNPHMHAFVTATAKGVSLAGKKIAIIGLGDHRYRYIARAADVLEGYVRHAGGALAVGTLRVLDEPWGQEEKIKKWGEELLRAIAAPASA